MNQDEQKMAIRRRASTTTKMFTKILNDPTAKNPGAWVIGFCVLEKDPGLELVKKVIKERIIDKYTRFHSTLSIDEKDQAIYSEISEDEFDWSYHFPDLSAETKGWNMEQVLTYLGGLNEFRYDMMKPLWRYLLIPCLDNGQAVMISCINHAIGDGLALVEVNEALYDPVPVEIKGEIKHQGKKPVVRKLDLLSQIGIFLYGIYHGLTIPLARPDPPNPLRLKKGEKAFGTKRIASAEPISLDRVKEIKNKMEGCTINDVLMGVMTMTLKEFFLEDGSSYKKGDRVTAQFPISMRNIGEGGLDLNGEPHNKISYAYFDFNFEGTREDIIWNTKHQIDCIKISPSPKVLDLSVRLAMKILPNQHILNLLTEAGNLGSAQLSNVPAPQGQVSMFGLKVVDMSFYLFSPLACYLGILTYNNVVNCAFNLDSGLGVDPKRLAKHWNREFEALYADVMSKPGIISEPKHNTEFYRKLALGFLYSIAGVIIFTILRMIFRAIFFWISK